MNPRCDECLMLRESGQYGLCERCTDHDDYDDFSNDWSEDEILRKQIQNSVLQKETLLTN